MKKKYFGVMRFLSNKLGWFNLKPVVKPIDMVHVLGIRQRVFVDEQNVDYEEEVIPEEEKEALHF